MQTYSPLQSKYAKFAATGQRGAVDLQVTQALLVPATVPARAPIGPTTCGWKGEGRGSINVLKVAQPFNWCSVLVRTKVTTGEAAE